MCSTTLQPIYKIRSKYLKKMDVHDKDNMPKCGIYINGETNTKHTP